MLPTILMTGIIVTYNESRRLEECLQSLPFCDEILVFDMGSGDESTAIALKSATRVKPSSGLNLLKKYGGIIIGEAKNDWIIFLDPDEVFPKELFPLIADAARVDTVALFSIPWQFYFLGEPLHSTVWGRKQFKARVFHRLRASLSHEIFGGVSVKPGYEARTFPYDENLAIKHYWVDNLMDMFKKHWRYIRNRGQACYKNGKKFDL